MMAAFAAYIKTITALTIFSALAGILLPEGKYRRYADLILGILILLAVLHPFLRLFGAAEEMQFPTVSLEETFREEYEKMGQDWMKYTYQTE